ncbi:PKD domain-containing protein [Chryseobacterium vrystaatense]|uniref:PKD domain-containing protein n=1 Tax=Chryseobacterium vrystaatense TaxID=307480 RepID=A0A1M5A1D2_9FLAO|nr:PKD domain-containing protein [Chryseobacterium vrystaatense]SHF24051.1 PKD domain-containing protein [Chryseobacterium vrystaatense]
MNYFQKNKKNIIIGVIATLLIAALVALWLQKKVIHSADDIVAVVYPSSLSVGDTLLFEDKTQFAKAKKWNFGDGSTSDQNRGIHFYNKPGYYSVSLIIDNKYTKTFAVMVSARQMKQKDSTKIATTIEAPAQAMQNENVQFRAVSDATRFAWKFGETGNTDAKDKMFIYAYKKPGDYRVTLLTDESEEPIYHMIKILPTYNSLEQDEVPVEDVYKKIDDDFKYHLQQIANGNSFNMHYNYLLRTYLCNNENTVVKVSDSKANNFYMYCAGLQFDKNVVIQSVKVNLDDKQICVTKVDINQSK